MEGPYGTHDVFILRPLGTSIRDLQKAMPGGVFNAEIVPEILIEILPTVHFLHKEANITHTGQLTELKPREEENIQIEK